MESWNIIDDIEKNVNCTACTCLYYGLTNVLSSLGYFNYFLRSQFELDAIPEMIFLRFQEFIAKLPKVVTCRHVSATNILLAAIWMSTK